MRYEVWSWLVIWRKQGAIIGKVMTSLKKGETGLILVLVTLQ